MLRFVFASLVLTIGLAANGQAATTFWRAGGQLPLIEEASGFDEHFSSFEHFTVHFTIDDSVARAPGFPDVMSFSNWPGAVTEMSVRFSGGNQAISTFPVSVLTALGHPYDQFSIEANAQFESTFDLIENAPEGFGTGRLQGIRVLLLDHEATFLNRIPPEFALPHPHFFEGSQDRMELEIRWGGDPVGGILIPSIGFDAIITTLVQVPEPNSFVLGLAGVVALSLVHPQAMKHSRR